MKKIFIGMAILSAGLFTSCSDFLTEEPKQEQSNELTFATFDGVNKAAAAMYGMFQSDAWYDGEFTLMSELRCGNAKNPTSVPGSGRYRSDTQWIYSDRSTSPLWRYAYYTIARANNVINNLDDKVGKDATQQQVNNVKAEALFIRALCYFDLVITYCQPYNYNATEDDKMGVPLVLVTENGKPARDSKENVYNQIVADLLQAESIMADDYVRAGVTDKAATPTKPAIQALLSRVYLYMNKWQEAADYATKVINNKKYELAPADAYAAMFSAATAPEGGEIIFEVYGSDKNEYWDNSGWAHLPYITTTDDQGSHGDVCATKDLYDLYSEGDIRKSMYKQHGNDYFPTKYSGKPKDSDPKYTNVPILRLSEMYLNRAEAIINGASIQGVTAESDLRKIATVRGASQTAAATKQGVFDERRRELAFEGHIAADYARCNKSMTRKDFDDSKNKDVAFPSYMWALPIPNRECTANPNVAQNPGY